MLTYKDFPVGKVFDLVERKITKEEIIEFASEFDPQPFHLDENSPQAEQVGGLIASGWHTSSTLMRMMCDTYLLDSASLGSPGLDEVRWLKPVRPGDTLSATAEVVSARISKSNPRVGLIGFHYTMKNQNGETVMTVKGPGLIDATPEAPAP